MSPRSAIARITLVFVCHGGFHPRPSPAHEIPNARVDRSIQVTLEPGRIRVAYEVSLAELTLTQELRSLIGGLPGADRREWFSAYGRETGPLDAKGLLVLVEESPIALAVDGFDFVVEEHPRFTFRFSAKIPDAGRLSLRDTNYRASEGTSRLAVGGIGVAIKGDALPTNVESILERPIWQLTDDEERRTREVQVDYQSGATRSPESKVQVRPQVSNTKGPSSLSRLLDRAATLPLSLLVVFAFGLGAAHALQPGHGKTLVAATMLGEGSTWKRGTALAIVTTATHLGSVLVIAWALWWTESLRFPEVHLFLTRGSGFLIATVGVWRLGRVLGGNPSHLDDPLMELSARPASLIGLGIAGGVVPCWDAVGLIVLSAAVDKVGLGIVLVGAFSLGMGTVLVVIGIVASSLRSSWMSACGSLRLETWLSVLSGLFLSVIGVYLLSV